MNSWNVDEIRKELAKREEEEKTSVEKSQLFKSKLFHIVLGLTTSVIVTLFSGYILSVLWSWWIVTKFNLPRLNVIESVGVMSVVNFLMISISLFLGYSEAFKETTNKMPSHKLGMYKNLITIFFVFPFILLSNYVWHLFL